MKVATKPVATNHNVISNVTAQSQALAESTKSLDAARASLKLAEENYETACAAFDAAIDSARKECAR